MLGIRCFSRFTALLASRMSTYNLTSSELFGTTTMRLTHGIGPVTFSIMSKLSSLSNSFSPVLSYMKGDSAVWLLSGLHIRIYVKLDYLSSHFADANRFYNSPLTRYWGLVLSIPTWLTFFRSPSLCAVSYPRRFPELPLKTCRADVL